MPEIDFTNINAHIYSFVEVYSVNPLKKIKAMDAANVTRMT